MPIEILEQFAEDFCSRYNEQISFLDFFPDRGMIRIYFKNGTLTAWDHKSRSFFSRVTTTAVTPVDSFGINLFEEMLDILLRKGCGLRFSSCYMEDNSLIMRDWECDYKFHYLPSSDELVREVIF